MFNLFTVLPLGISDADRKGGDTIQLFERCLKTHVKPCNQMDNTVLFMHVMIHLRTQNRED